MTAKYLEDVTPGERYSASHTVELTEAEVIEFASRYDPQPMHTDPTFPSGLIASGWHTCALAMRLTIDTRFFGSTMVLGMGVDELRWPTPARPGDIIRSDYEVVSVTPSKSKPDFG